MSRIQQFLNIFFQLRRKILTFSTFQKLQLFKEELENQKQNRDYIGVDRDGNKYYQYYSYFGLPTKREIDFKDRLNIHINDLAYFDWLTNRQPYQPTPSELQDYYQDEAQRKFLGQQWDQQEEQLMQSFYKQQQIQQQINQERIQAQQQTLLSKDSQATEIQKEIQSNQPLIQQEEQQQQNQKDKDYQPTAWSPKNKRRQQS